MWEGERGGEGEREGEREGWREGERGREGEREKGREKCVSAGPAVPEPLADLVQMVGRDGGQR